MDDPNLPAVPESSATDTPVNDAPPEIAGSPETPSVPTETPASEPAAPALFAGKFKTSEEAYWHSQGELAALRTKSTDTPAPATSTPKYTTDQLWTVRAQKLQEMTAAQIAGNTEQAGTLAANVNWIDNEIQQQSMQKFRGELTAQSALQTLNTDGAELLKPYQADLVPGNPLYEQAQTYFGLMKQAMGAGVPLDNVLSGLAVLAAAAKTGKHLAGTEQAARTEFAGALKQSIKQAIITGGGKATQTPNAAPDVRNMTDKQFDDYRRTLGVLS